MWCYMTSNRKWINTIMMNEVVGRKKARVAVATIKRQIGVDSDIRQLQVPRRTGDKGDKGFVFIIHFELYSAIETYEKLVRKEDSRWITIWKDYLNMLYKVKEHYD